MYKVQDLHSEKIVYSFLCSVPSLTTEYKVKVWFKKKKSDGSGLILKDFYILGIQVVNSLGWI